MAVPAVYRLFGSEFSPYSTKTRAYLCFKGIAFDWVVRTHQNMEEFNRLATVPLVPLIVDPQGKAMQDSTLIIARLEAIHPHPSVYPPQAVTAFVSVLLEEYGDEWGNRQMAHYRWFHDREYTIAQVIDMRFSGADAATRAREAENLRNVRVPQILAIAGSNAANAPVIEESLQRLVMALEQHLARRPYLFGDRPALADFAIAAQLMQCANDLTAGRWMRGLPATQVLAWCQRMTAPGVQGGFEPWENLSPTLLPLLRDEVANVFLRWSAANEQADARGGAAFSIETGQMTFHHTGQRYSAKSLAAMRKVYAALPPADRSAIDAALALTGCLRWLEAIDLSS